MALPELVRNMNQLESELQRFELKFGVKSLNFYQEIISGLLDEFDALDDYRMDFVEWLGLYEAWMSLNDKYEQMISLQPVAIQIRSNVENSTIYLKVEKELRYI